MGIDVIYICLTCKKYLYNGRLIEGQRLREYLNGKVTERKIQRVKRIQRDLRKVFDEGWLIDHYGMLDHYDLSELISFLERHLGHKIYIGTDHDLDLPMDYEEGYVAEEVERDALEG